MLKQKQRQQLPQSLLFRYLPTCVGNTTYKTTKLVHFILQNNSSYNDIYIYAPSLPMSSRT